MVKATSANICVFVESFFGIYVVIVTKEIVVSQGSDNVAGNVSFGSG